MKSVPQLEKLIFFKDNKNLHEVLKVIYRQGITSVLVEGGGEILKSFIKSGLWHEARIITVSQKLHEGISAPMLQGTLKKKWIIQDNEVNFIKNNHFQLDE